MSKRLIQVAACVFFLLMALTPLVEFFDHWDGPCTPATDTEMRVTFLLVMGGTIAAVAQMVKAAAAAPPRDDRAELLVATTGGSRPSGLCIPIPTPSPPLAPLRI